MDVFELQQDEELDDYVYRISETKLGVCRWGSFQYASMQATYDTLNKMKKAGLSEDEMWKFMGVEVELGESTSLEVVLKVIKNYMIKDIIDCYCLDRLETFDQKGQMILDLLLETRFDSLDTAIIKLGESSWDLWSTIPFIFRKVYLDSQIKCLFVKGVGPIFKQMVQSDDISMGIQAWILSQNMGVQDQSYHDFDT